jgi:hypothetical protein
MAINKMHSPMMSITEFVIKIEALPETILSKTGPLQPIGINARLIQLF